MHIHDIHQATLKPFRKSRAVNPDSDPGRLWRCEGGVGEAASDRRRSRNSTSELAQLRICTSSFDIFPKSVNSSHSSDIRKLRKHFKILIFEVIQLRLDATPLLLPFIPTVFGETSIILHRLTVSRNLTVSEKSVNFNGIKVNLLSLVQGHVWVAILTDNRWIVGWKCFWQRHSCLVTCGAAMCYTRNFPNVTLYIGLNAFGSPV